MDPEIHKSSLAAKSDIYVKGHKRKVLKEGEDCVSSTLSAKMDGDMEEKTKEDSLEVVDPFAIPNLFRSLDRRRFGSVTEEIEALRSMKIKRLNASQGVKPTQSFMFSDVGKTKRRNSLNLVEIQDAQPSHQNVISNRGSSPMHPIDIDQWVSHQATETLSDQSVTQPAQNVTHSEDDNAGNDDKEVTMVIIISDSDDEDDGVQMPSHQCHKASEKSLTDVPSMNDLMVRDSAEKEAPKEGGSAVVEIDIGPNKSINLHDCYVEVRDSVERKAQEEEVSNKFALEMDESVDQVTGCPGKNALEEEVEMVLSIEDRSPKSTYNDTDENMMIEEDNNWVYIADDMGSKPSEINIEMIKNVDQVTGCSERKALEDEVEMVLNIEDRSAKNTYIDTNENMMIEADNDWIYIADDMGSKPSEIHIEMTGCSGKKALEEEVEAVPDIDVRSAKNTCTEIQSSEIDTELDKNFDHVERETSGKEVESIPDIAVMDEKYIDTNDDMVIEENNNQTDSENDDGLDNIWNEMALALALEGSKDITPVSVTTEQSKEDEELCDHHLTVLKDDLGYVCRICGIIKEGIETIFDFQYSKVKRTIRTYVSEPQERSSRELHGIRPSGVNSLGDNSMLTETCILPTHHKQMKPHQVEGFNFLCRNLLADDPRGCILAHAPGSGKTFMIISFLQSFLAKHPDGRPLVVLPKGILETWKKEFQTWHVEDMPLLDFYTARADNRSQQLDVLLKWEKQKSILFVGYQQFSAIICDNRSCQETADCRDKLLKVPSILIIDEGHNPRNQETDLVQSLAKVRTPCKVVLSGTLYQNHVKEVFNILNLVRPKFLRYDTSRAAVSRIMSTALVSGSRKHLKAGRDSAFFDSVEYTLQKDENLERKKAVIENLRVMTNIVLHYYKGDFLEELPGLVDFTVVLNLSDKQKEEVQKLKKLDRFKQIAVGSTLYVHPELKDFSARYPAAGDWNSSVNLKRIDQMLEKLNLRHGVKIKFFLDLLALCEATGEKLLVFSQYILPLKLLERASVKNKGWTAGKEIFLITGDSSYEQRERCMQQFNSSPDAKVFFGSIKACGEGISLVGASRILILDVHLNPSVTRQAIGRAFRPGQKRKVYTYRLVAADSPEEEDFHTCFRKEVISKMWFEWNGSSDFQDFEMNTVDLDKCDDLFFDSPLLREDLKVLYKR